MPQSSFVKAMKDFFGLLPGQTVLEFGRELRALSHEEKVDFARVCAFERLKGPPTERGVR